MKKLREKKEIKKALIDMKGSFAGSEMSGSMISLGSIQTTMTLKTSPVPDNLAVLALMLPSSVFGYVEKEVDTESRSGTRPPPGARV